MDEREGYEEINALVGAIAKALGLPADQTAQEIETGRIVLGLEEDESGHRYIDVRRDDARARVYQGAIRYAPGTEPPSEPGRGEEG